MKFENIEIRKRKESSNMYLKESESRDSELPYPIGLACFLIEGHCIVPSCYFLNLPNK